MIAPTGSAGSRRPGRRCETQHDEEQHGPGPERDDLARDERYEDHPSMLKTMK